MPPVQFAMVMSMDGEGRVYGLFPSMEEANAWAERRVAASGCSEASWDYFEVHSPVVAEDAAARFIQSLRSRTPQHASGDHRRSAPI